MFEDVGRLADKPAAQVELIHTMDAVMQEGGQVVVTAAVSPGELRDLTPALQSRLLAGLAVALSPPGPAARLAIVRQLAALRDIELAEPVAQALAEGLGGTVPELLGALVQLDVPARLDGQSIDAEAVRYYLAKRNGARQPQLSDIAAAGGPIFFPEALRAARPVSATAGGGRPRCGHVPGTQPHANQPAADRPLLRRPRPHHGDARLPQDRAPCCRPTR